MPSNLSFISADNLSAWERYERERDGLAAKLDAAEGEMMDTKRVKFPLKLSLMFWTTYIFLE